MEPVHEVLHRPVPMETEIAAVNEPVGSLTIWWQHFISIVSSIYFSLALFAICSALFIGFVLKSHFSPKQFPCDRKLFVSIDGSAQFQTITEAIQAAQPYNVLRTCIIIGKGEFVETVTVPTEKTNLVLIGAGKNKTVITAMSLFSDTNRGVLNVRGRGFVAMDLTVANTMSPSEGNAIAVVNMADESVFFRCSFIGFGRTLYAEEKKQFYRECDIHGSRNLVYGGGGAHAFFQKCNIKVSMSHAETVISGNVRISKLDLAEFIFHMCAFGPDANVVNSSIYLGAPITLYSRVVVMESDLDESVLGWMIDSNFTCTRDVYLAEYMNRGPGATNEHKGSGLLCTHFIVSRTLAEPFSLRNFFSNYSWIPKKVSRQLDL